MSNETRNYQGIILPLLDKDLMSMTDPDKPKSSKQKYFTTALGLSLIDYL